MSESGAERKENARELAKAILRGEGRKERSKHFWDAGVLDVGVGTMLMVTDLWPFMYWPGVILGYFGAVSLAWPKVIEPGVRESP
jgi:hypothetical protein